MAKRTRPRSHANETSASHSSETPGTTAQPTAHRSRAAATDDTIGAYPGVERSEEDGAITRAVAGESSGSRSMASEPSDEDIRARAYQRYLERGGDHGMDFEDWLTAERELKGSRV
jgi:hypothetical protein